MTLVGRNVWFFMTEKPGPHTFPEKLLPVSARKRHFHDNDIWLQRLKFISFLLLTLSCRSCWGLKTIVLISARNNKLKNILVVVVKWRHRAIVLFRVLSFQVGEQYRLDVFIAERFKCDSNLFVQASGVDFVRQWEEILPVDYIADVSENTPAGSLLQVWC